MLNTILAEFFKNLVTLLLIPTFFVLPKHCYFKLKSNERLLQWPVL